MGKQDYILIGVGTIFVGIVAGLVYFKFRPRNTEPYGAMKNIRQIPFNDCARLCNGHMNKCKSDFRDADPTWCERKRDACIAECYYTPYHQLNG